MGVVLAQRENLMDSARAIARNTCVSIACLCCKTRARTSAGCFGHIVAVRMRTITSCDYGDTTEVSRASVNKVFGQSAPGAHSTAVTTGLPGPSLPLLSSPSVQVIQ
ncbi:hypothetical protein E2C01_008778 [Portunus trituberculatus]|uniref:Uncharacterized protein n=1 Tax=Portunus trituberculatus TaxID=210409 RepID=A0A5B7D1P4_PORTR|nr:hypothetical protein [Portunus trituberculatus]